MATGFDWNILSLQETKQHSLAAPLRFRPLPIIRIHPIGLFTTGENVRPVLKFPEFRESV